MKSELATESVKMIAVTADDFIPVELPTDLVGTLNEQFKKFPDGVPMTMQSGRHIEVFALMVCCKNIADHKPLMIFTKKEDSE